MTTKRYDVTALDNLTAILAAGDAVNLWATMEDGDAHRARLVAQIDVTKARKGKTRTSKTALRNDATAKHVREWFREVATEPMTAREIADALSGTIKDFTPDADGKPKTAKVGAIIKLLRNRGEVVPSPWCVGHKADGTETLTADKRKGAVTYHLTGFDFGPFDPTAK